MLRNGQAVCSLACALASPTILTLPILSLNIPQRYLQPCAALLSRNS